jgi:hypothetical protein
MRVEPSGVEGVELLGSESRGFPQALELLGQTAPDAALRAALRYSAVLINRDERFIALLGVRFDMIGRSGKACSVVHYADTLRYPEQANIAPGGARLVCAEPYYTDRMLGREPAPREAAERARMNIENLRFGRNHRASLDCVAFADGEFLGPDSRGAFDRITAERAAELDLIGALVGTPAGAADPRALLERESENADALRARRALANRLKTIFDEQGAEAALEYARNHKLRFPLWRARSATP